MLVADNRLPNSISSIINTLPSTCGHDGTRHSPYTLISGSRTSSLANDGDDFHSITTPNTLTRSKRRGSLLHEEAADIQRFRNDKVRKLMSLIPLLLLLGFHGIDHDEQGSSMLKVIHLTPFVPSSCLRIPSFLGREPLRNPSTERAPRTIDDIPNRLDSGAVVWDPADCADHPSPRPAGSVLVLLLQHTSLPRPVMSDGWINATLRLV